MLFFSAILLLATPRESSRGEHRQRSGMRHEGYAEDQRRAAARDAELIARLTQDDDTALSFLVGTYAERLRSFAYLTVRDPDLAADVVQDVFVWLWAHRKNLKVAGTTADYLYKATRHRALNVVKHEQAHERMRTRVGAQYVVTPPTTSNADTALAAQELAMAVDTALQALTPRVREVFLLARIEHMSADEIATVLNVSVTTVHSQLSRAIKHIRERLAAG